MNSVIKAMITLDDKQNQHILFSTLGSSIQYRKISHRLSFNLINWIGCNRSIRECHFHHVLSLLVRTLGTRTLLATRVVAGAWSGQLTDGLWVLRFTFFYAELQLMLTSGVLLTLVFSFCAL